MTKIELKSPYSDTLCQQTKKVKIDEWNDMKMITMEWNVNDIIRPGLSSIESVQSWKRRKRLRRIGAKKKMSFKLLMKKSRWESKKRNVLRGDGFEGHCKVTAAEVRVWSFLYSKKRGNWRRLVVLKRLVCKRNYFILYAFRNF